METPESIRGFLTQWKIGLLNRPLRHLPSHFHPPRLKKIPKVHPPSPNLAIFLSAFQASDSPTGLYNDIQRSEAIGTLQGNQTPPVPGRLAHQGAISERVTFKCKDHCEPNRVLGLAYQSRKSERTLTQVFSFMGFEHHLFSPCKTRSRHMVKTTGLCP